ncbi:MAG: hypothetical protein V3T77_03345, partial [Planctomycetota bacterium]
MVIQSSKAAGEASPKAFAAPAIDEGERTALEVSKGILYVGIDLGTSRSAISASNGARECVASVVGWPRDSISTKLRGKAALFGVEALDKRLSLETVFPLHNGSLAYPDHKGEMSQKLHMAAQELLNHLVSLARPRKDQLIYALLSAPAEANRKDKQGLLDIARNA